MKTRLSGIHTSPPSLPPHNTHANMVSLATTKAPTTTILVHKVSTSKQPGAPPEQTIASMTTIYDSLNTKVPRPTSPKDTAASPNGLLTPKANGIRKASGDQSKVATSPLSPSSDNANQWSSAVGHATTAGKSGRVIERLMTENDRLKRELNEQLVKAEELQRNLQMYKPKIEALQAENENLSHTSSVDTALITRRDRKIEELKTELAAEKSRREAIETRARIAERERDDALETKARELQTMQESTRHATVHAEILETSHRQLASEYRARMHAATKELDTVRADAAHDRAALRRLDVVADQMRTELERSRRVNAEMLTKWEELDELSKHKLRTVVEDAEAENNRSRELSARMQEVVHEMRWLMGVKKSRGEDGEA